MSIPNYTRKTAEISYDLRRKNKLRIASICESEVWREERRGKKSQRIILRYSGKEERKRGRREKKTGEEVSKLRGERGRKGWLNATKREERLEKVNIYETVKHKIRKNAPLKGSLSGNHESISSSFGLLTVGEIPYKYKLNYFWQEKHCDHVETGITIWYREEKKCFPISLRQCSIYFHSYLSISLFLFPVHKLCPTILSGSRNWNQQLISIGNSVRNTWRRLFLSQSHGPETR